MRRALIALALLLGASSAHAGGAADRWHARNASLPLRLQVLPGSPFTPSGGGGAGGASLTGTNVFAGSNTFTDSLFFLSDDVTPTKLAQFQLSGITAATTRTYTVPNADTTLAGLSVQQTWTNFQSFGSSGIVQDNAEWIWGTGNDSSIVWNTAQTPDTWLFGTSIDSNAIVIAERADAAFGFAHPLQVNPTAFFENAAQDTTQHQGVTFYGSQGRAIKALTETTNTAVVQIPVAAGAGVGGTITFTAFAADATDQQTLTGVLQYAAVNKAATETCAVPTLTGTALNSVSVGTLTCTYACDTTPANAVNIQFNCTSSLTQTTLDLYWRLNALGASEPLPQ